MSFLDTLVTAGFTKEEAKSLTASEYFIQRYSNKSAEEITALIGSIAETYRLWESVVRSAISTFPPFANYDHQRVLKGLEEAYGFTREQSAKAISTHPQFASYDHQRVLRQLSRVGRMVGLSRGSVIGKIQERPVLASYSAKRYLAAIDVGRHLKREGNYNTEEMLAAWFGLASKSPYVPGMGRTSLTQVLRKNNCTTEPPLMGALRKKIQRGERRVLA